MLLFIQTAEGIGGISLYFLFPSTPVLPLCSYTQNAKNKQNQNMKNKVCNHPYNIV